jgi:hypothetical protein
VRWTARLYAVLDVGDISTGDEHRSRAYSDRQERGKGPARVSKDVSESDFERQHHPLPDLCSTSWPSRIVNVSSACDIK